MATRLAHDLFRHEAPGINTLLDGAPTVVWDEALGANVRDVDGNTYVDLTSGFGVAAVGHRHPRVVAAITRQANRLLHGLADVAAHPARITLASNLTRLAPMAGDKEPQVYFAVSGADAVEIALKTAHLATGKPGVVAFEPAYHGLTLGALAVTSRPGFRAPFAQHLHPHVHRLPYACPPEDVRRLLKERPDIGALIVEPIAGREGVLVPPRGWLGEIATHCRHSRVLLIADEIFTGLGRTGSLFAVLDEAVEPDLLCCGKALGGGLPIAAVLGPRRLMASWQKNGEALHTGTFVAHPLACAAALAVLEVLQEERLVERTQRLETRVASRLRAWESGFSTVTGVRGRGLAWAVQVDGARIAREWTGRAWRRGVFLLAGGPRGNVVQIVPPLTITREQLDVALGILEETLHDVGSSCTDRV